MIATQYGRVACSGIDQALGEAIVAALPLDAHQLLQYHGQAAWPQELRTSLGKWAGLVGAGLRGRDLGPRFGFAKRHVTSRVDLDLLRLGFPHRGFLVGRRFRHSGVPGYCRHALLSEELYVIRLVGKALDREGVDLQPAGGEVSLGRVLHLLQELLAVADELLDGQRADDRSQRSLEHVLDDRVDLLRLGVEESLGGVAQRLDVAPDLEGGHALDLDLDALAGDGVAQLHVDLARGQLELADAIEQRPDEGTASDDDLDPLVSGVRGGLPFFVAHLGTA